MKVIKKTARRRELVEYGSYHVGGKICRGNDFLSDVEIKNLYLSVLEECKKKKHKFDIFNLCVMDNHIHFIIRPAKGENLSKIMQWINSVFAMRYNKITGGFGPVWNGRFWSRVIRNIIEFLIVYEYISVNPVKAGLCESPDEYRFGGMYFLKHNIRDIVTPYWEVDLGFWTKIFKSLIPWWRIKRFPGNNFQILKAGKPYLHELPYTFNRLFPLENNLIKGACNCNPKTEWPCLDLFPLVLSIRMGYWCHIRS